MFVHDFTSVEMPVDPAIGPFSSLSPGRLSTVVAAIWNTESQVLETACQPAATPVAVQSLQVELHGHRWRADAAVVSIRWHGDGWLPSLDTDLELVAFGSATRHLHLMGRYELPARIQRFTTDGSLVQRVMVVVIREFLNDLSSILRTDLLHRHADEQ